MPDCICRALIPNDSQLAYTLKRQGREGGHLQMCLDWQEHGVLVAPPDAKRDLDDEDDDTPVTNKRQAAAVGITFGAALAMTISWSVNKSVLLALIHGLFGWIYVGYYWLWY